MKPLSLHLGFFFSKRSKSLSGVGGNKAYAGGYIGWDEFSHYYVWREDDTMFVMMIAFMALRLVDAPAFMMEDLVV